MKVIFLLFMIYILYCFTKTNVYEYFQPNETQITICSSKDGKGETSTYIKENKIPIPQKGLYSSLIENTNEKNYQSYFKTPDSCPNPSSFPLLRDPDIRNYFGNNIIDGNIKLNPPYINPFDDKYASPDENHSILYEDIYHDIFKDQHQKLIDTDDRF